jgi:hypothetical protein
MEYKIYMHECSGVPAGWFTNESLRANVPLFARSQHEEDAYLFKAREIPHVVQSFRGWPCHCVPPLTITTNY